MRPPRLITLIVGALAVLLCVVGCSKSTSASSKSSAASSGAASSKASSPTTLVQNSLPAATSIVNNVDKRKSVTVTKCLPTDGGWTASGTAVNPGTADVTYAITVFFTNEHATVEDFTTAAVTVKSGQTANWSATKKFAAATPTNCVLRGVG